MDNFIVSARKYRPSTFETVVGQAHITSTLRNAIERGQLAHAYLFCGPRGVGKTTCARIFAKSINCLDPRGSEACGVCESCRAFDEGRSFNIHELDAASNNSVDDIRSITEQVRIPPQIGHYSVYIIDEVHMLSQAAFNAFLKTLEEPPAHAIFILATTEKHKIIPTILSRCQIYDFNRIRVEDGVAYLKHIATQEGISYDDESLNLIAAKADGGMRDALSMFDKAVAFCGPSLNFREVARTLNVLDYDTYFNITSLAAAGDYKQALLIFDKVLGNGFSAQTFTGGLASHLRDLLMCKDTATLPLLDVTGSLLQRYREQSATLGTRFLFEAAALINSIDSTLRTAVNGRLHVELGLMKLCGIGQRGTGRQAEDAPVLPPVKGEAASSHSPTHPSPESAAASREAETFGRTIPPAEAATNTYDGTYATHSLPGGGEAYINEHKPSRETSAKQTFADKRPDKSDGAPVSHPENTAVPSPAGSEASSPSGTETRGRSLSGVSINNILKGGAGRDRAAKEEPEKPAAPAPADPNMESRIVEAQPAFIEALSRIRPRFATAFSAMKVKGNNLSITVSTELLRDDIVQHQREIANLLRETAGVEGALRFEIEVSEDKSAVRPIKPEDKLTHLRGKNTAIDDLRRELDLEME